jgi:fatty acid desaturase
MTSDEYISDQWADYKRRAKWFAAVFIAMVPMALLLIFCLQYDWLVPAAMIAIVWLVALCVVVVRLQFFPCPNCGKPFGFRYVNNLPLSVSACVHCGLPKWEH